MNIRNLGVALLTLVAVACGGKEFHDDHDKHGEEANKHEEKGSRSGVVEIDTAAIKRMGIVISSVEIAPVVGGIVVPAEIQAEPDRVAHIASVVSGQVASVSVSIGDRVKPKQILAKVRSVALGQARAQSSRAHANLQAAKADLARQQELQKEGIGAQRNLIAAEAAHARAKAEVSASYRALQVYGRGGRGSEVAIRSPISGQVVKRHASVGEVISPSHVLFEVTDIEKVWVLGRVYQQHAGKVQVGVSAFLTLQAYPGRSWQGTVSYVAPALDERTRTLPVRMELENPERILRPGLFGSLSISPTKELSEQALFIRLDALQQVGASLVVFVPKVTDGQFQAVPVAVGQRSLGRVQVLSGVSAGDQYVSAGAFVLKSELLRSELSDGHAH